MASFDQTPRGSPSFSRRFGGSYEQVGSVLAEKILDSLAAAVTLGDALGAGSRHISQKPLLKHQRDLRPDHLVVLSTWFLRHGVSH